MTSKSNLHNIYQRPPGQTSLFAAFKKQDAVASQQKADGYIAPTEEEKWEKQKAETSLNASRKQGPGRPRKDHTAEAAANKVEAAAAAADEAGGRYAAIAHAARVRVQIVSTEEELERSWRCRGRVGMKLSQSQRWWS